MRGWSNYWSYPLAENQVGWFKAILADDSPAKQLVPASPARARTKGGPVNRGSTKELEYGVAKTTCSLPDYRLLAG